MLDNIKWLGHGSFVIQGPPFIFIDPWRVVRSAFHADIILVSHKDFDSCSSADIEKLRGEKTVIIGNEEVAKLIDGVTVLRPWQSMSFERLSIKAVPAYSPDEEHHPKSAGGLGFVISMNFYDIYYAGDTKLIPEMEKIRPDIAILPINNNDTLSVREAVKAVEILKPRWVIPSHWGAIGDGASDVDAKDFQKLVGTKAEVIIPNNKNHQD